MGPNPVIFVTHTHTGSLPSPVPFLASKPPCLVPSPPPLRVRGQDILPDATTRDLTMLLEYLCARDAVRLGPSGETGETGTRRGRLLWRFLERWRGGGVAIAKSQRVLQAWSFGGRWA